MNCFIFGSIHLRKRVVVAFALLLLCISAYSRPIWVSLYNNTQVRSVVVSAYNGPLYAVMDGRERLTIVKGQAVYVTLRDGKLWMSNTGGVIGSFEKLSLQGVDTTVVVRLRPVSPQVEARNYEETVWLCADVDRIRLVNCIDEERYIAGVVEAEVGQGRPPEFYKAKAIICRTYLYGHINRHENEGVHMCDETHCQAYKGQCRYRDVINTAVWDTKGIILTDRENSMPILAAYHSNCGGETESARNAWQNNLPYLVPVTDPYCVSLLNAKWQKTIPLDDWLKYLVKNGFKPNPKVVTDFSFQQVHRMPDYTVNNFTLPVKQIRTDWQLRSTFFSISVEDGNVIFSGRGYGHGVGLCQEGAMEMGRRGHKYGDIISFYYKYVNLVPVSTLSIRIPEFGTDLE